MEITMETTWTRKEYETWDEAFRALSPIIRQQSVRVASYTQVLFVQACSMSFGKESAAGAEQMRSKYAELSYKCGMYHQLGKALVPKEYQVWQDDFTEEEAAVYKKYTTDGRRLVTRLQEKTQWTISKRGKDIDDSKTLNVPWMMIRESCEHHMERFNGRGYPDGLSGDEISPIAQIVGLAKEIDMITSTRRSEDPFAEAYEEITAQAGKAFSEDLIKVFEKAKNACREVYNKYINYTLTIPKTIPLVNKHRDRPMGLAFYNTLDPLANKVRSYEAIPWFKGIENDSESTETIYDVEPMLLRLEMLSKMAFFLLYEAADTVLRIQTCKLPIDAIVIEMFPSFYINKSEIQGFEKLFNDQPIDKSRLILTIPTDVVSNADEKTMSNIREYINFGVSLMLDKWTPELISIDDVIEMGFVAVRVDNSMLLKRESAEIIKQLREKGIHVYAKGIENDDEKRWLVACGVQHISGPALSRTVTEDELIKDALLRERAYE